MIKRLLFILSLPLLLHARKAIDEAQELTNSAPWLTGPLLTASGHVVPVGHQNYEPYVIWNSLTGKYNNHWHYERKPPTYHTMLSQTVFQFGILPRVELDILPQFVYNNCNKKHAWHVFDQPIAVGIQLIYDEPGRWHPAVKVRLGAIIPVGKYDRLDPKKFLTDVAGGGNWAPNISIITSRLFRFSGHYLGWRTSWSYIVPLPIPVHGLSLYGGAPSIGPLKGTRGTVHQGNIFTLLQGFEYTLTRNWALALDIEYTHFNKTRFTGYSPPGTAPISPAAEQFSLAPAIEYNFNVNIGIIAGPWFAIGGRNNNLSNRFIAWVFAINIFN